MSSAIDPAKLKVVDLRSELSARGLDSKGNKAALVKRLKDALEKELKQDLPDTSIADTSTEDFDTSQTDEKVHDITKKENDKPPADEKMETDEPKPNKTPEKPKVPTESKSPEKPKTDVKSPEKQKSAKAEEVKSSSSGQSDAKSEPSEKLKPAKPTSDLPAAKTEVTEQKTEENGEHSEQTGEKVHKSRWSEDDKPSDEVVGAQQADNKEEGSEAGTSKPEGEPDQKGEKRRRTSPSPDRSQRRRSRSPIKEDEPTIDNDKVQLNWYDSDLHLQLDKESFLSAKPLTEGAFGYAWAGVRGTHGASSGKVCYEVKLIEELKWEDISKHDQRGRDRYRTDHRKNQKRDKDKKDFDKKSTEKPKTENIENKDETPADKTAEEEGSATDKTEIAEKMDEDAAESATKDSEKSDEKPMETDEKPAEKPESDEKEVEATSVDTKKAENEANDSKPKDDKLEAEEEKKEVPSDPIPTHLLRVGWSLVTSSLQLGEEKHSYGYESSGKFVTDKQFVNYGNKFGVGDVIGAFLDINSENVTIRYTVNGEVQDVATTVPRADFPEEDFALFPHILSRNYAFEINLGEREEPWFPIPAELEGYLYLSKAENKVAGPMRPENRGECEVILMCGLPASGKTHWVREHVSSNIDKRYTVLGNTNLLEKMTVSGEPLKSKFKGRWSLLVDKIQKCLNKLISIAALRRRNYIIDQTNVFPSAQRRKMRPFEGFKRHAVIVVVGDEEQARRQSLQEAQDGKDVPDSTILEMKAAMALPEKGEWLEEITYIGLEEAEAKEIVKKYNTMGKEAGYGGEKRFGRRDVRWQNRRNDFRGGKSYRERSYHSQRYDPRGPRHGGWNDQRSRGGNWNRDRRDNRRPSHEWRGGGRDQVSRGGRGQGGNYNRNHGQGGGRGNWSGWGNQGWNQQGFGSGSGGYSSQGWGNQWKYNQGGSGGGGGGGSGSGGQGYGNYQNWNYYGQYAQNWNNQGQQTQSAMGTGSGNGTVNSQYGQAYNTQEVWAQYARQYAQQSAAAQNQAASNSKK